MEIKRVAIIGLGALGILFGQHLRKQMQEDDLLFIVDQERKERYEKNGFFANGEQCQFHYVLRDERVEPVDLVIFTVKYDGLRDALEAVENIVDDHTIFISALNGIVSEEVIGEKYRLENVIYAVAQGMDAVKIGNKLTYSNMGMLCFGDREPGVISEKTKRVARFFEKTNFPHEVVTDMQKRQWGKFMTNVGVNQTVAVYNGNYGTIQQKGEARETMIQAMREVIILSEKEGIHLTEDDLTYWLNILDELDPEKKPSLAQDMDAKRYSEVELFSGTVLTLAEKYHLDTPVNRMLYDKITAIERTYE